MTAALFGNLGYRFGSAVLMWVVMATRKSRFMLVLIGWLACPSVGNTQDVDSGNFWLPMCAGQRGSVADAMCIAYIQGLGSAYSFWDVRANLGKLCIPAGVTIDQMRAVIVKNLQERPDQWHRPFVVLSYEALIGAYPCEPHGH